MDYSRGKYNVLDANSNIVGRIDEDEFIREFDGANLLYRIDEGQLYGMDEKLLGFIESGVAKTQSGKFILKIVDEETHNNSLSRSRRVNAPPRLGCRYAF